MPLNDPEFATLSRTVLAGVLIFLTLERRIEDPVSIGKNTIYEGGKLQREDKNFVNRVEEARKQVRKKRLRYVV